MSRWEPPWLKIARDCIGQAEKLGPESNEWIAKLWVGAEGAWVYATAGKDDSRAPWCGAFIRQVFYDYDPAIVPARPYYRARAWLDWGQKLAAPVVGCVAILDGGPKRPGSGHVTLVAGRDWQDRLSCIGGNQHDQVDLSAFPRYRFLGYRWPAGIPVRGESLPIVIPETAPSVVEA